MTEVTMMERLARAAVDAHYGGGGIEERTLEAEVENFKPAVRAILTELRVPTEEMVAAIQYDPWAARSEISQRNDGVEAWQAMIDCVLGE